MQADFNHQSACYMEEIIYQCRYKLVRERFPTFLRGARCVGVLDLNVQNGPERIEN